jgi:hypothetical protein
MTDSGQKTNFPVIDLAEMLIPWEKCFKVHVGAIDQEAIGIMDEKKFDFAPVFDHQSTKPRLLGLISGHRLKELNGMMQTLTPTDPGITSPQIQSKISMETTLDFMVLKTAYIVIESRSTHGREPIGLFTRLISTNIHFVRRFIL